jgi:hypothetical protein
VLLEVLVALAILILGMAAVGMQVNVGLKVATDTQVATRAVQLADTKWSELDAGVQEWNPNEEMEGDFGIHYPGWAWRMYIEPTDTPDLNMATLEILYKPGVKFREELATYEDMIVVHTSYSLRATPAKVNLADFGVDLSELEGSGTSGSSTDTTSDVSGNAAGGAAAGGAGGGRAGKASPAELLSELMALMPQGLDLTNIPPDFIKHLPPENIPEILKIVQQLLGPGGALLGGSQGGLSELIQQMDKQSGKDAGAGAGGPDAGDAGGQPSMDGPPDRLSGLPTDGPRIGPRQPRRGGPDAGGTAGDTSDGPRPRRGGGRMGQDNAGSDGGPDAGGNAGDTRGPRPRRGGPDSGRDGGSGRDSGSGRGGNRSNEFGDGTGRGGSGANSSGDGGGRGFSRSNSGNTGFGRSNSSGSGSRFSGGSSGGGQSGPGPRDSRFGNRSTGSSGGRRTGNAGLSDPYRVPTEQDLYGGRPSGMRR